MMIKQSLMKPGFLILALLAVLIPTARVQAQNKDLTTLVEGNNQFAVDLYQQLGKKPGNKFFSPYSISTALGMTYAGAKGQTAQEMASTLHFTLENDRLHPAFGELIRLIQGTDRKRDFQLTTANSLWGEKTNFKLNADFLRITQTDYQAGLQLVDFTKDPEGARKKINAWVEDKTNNKIKELLQPDVIDKDTRLVLVNGIYFKGSWQHPFSKSETRPDAFTIPGVPAFKVPMMNLHFDVNYLGNDEFQLAQVPYKGNDISMVILLPRKVDGLAEIEMKLSSRMLQQALAQTKSTYVFMTLPKFKMTEAFDLGDDLKRMGMNTPFVERKADFTGMVEKASSEDSLYISRVVHKGFVDVHEEGTEAAASTAVVVEHGATARPPGIRFKADHPFLFLIRHNATGSILFMGRVHDPRGN